MVAPRMIGKTAMAASAVFLSSAKRISERLRSGSARPRRPPPPMTTVPLAICLKESGRPAEPTTASQKCGICAVTIIIGAIGSSGTGSPSWAATSPAQAPAQLRICRPMNVPASVSTCHSPPTWRTALARTSSWKRTPSEAALRPKAKVVW